MAKIAKDSNHLLKVMPEDQYKIDELTAKLWVDPKLVKDLLAEVAGQITKEYLTIEELAKRLSWQERTVKNKMDAGIFKKGVHYFAPKGIRPRFKWSAVVAWLEENEARQRSESTPSEGQAQELGEAIPMARGYLLGHRRKRKLTGTS